MFGALPCWDSRDQRRDQKGDQKTVATRTCLVQPKRYYALDCQWGTTYLRWVYGVPRRKPMG